MGEDFEIQFNIGIKGTNKTVISGEYVVTGKRDFETRVS